MALMKAIGSSHRRAELLIGAHYRSPAADLGVGADFRRIIFKLPICLKMFCKSPRSAIRVDLKAKAKASESYIARLTGTKPDQPRFAKLQMCPYKTSCCAEHLIFSERELMFMFAICRRRNLTSCALQSSEVAVDRQESMVLQS